MVTSRFLPCVDFIPKSLISVTLYQTKFSGYKYGEEGLSYPRICEHQSQSDDVVFVFELTKHIVHFRYLK